MKKDGSTVGTLGGGCVEGDIWFAAKEALREKSGPSYKRYYLNEDIAARDGLVCELIEYHESFAEAKSYPRTACDNAGHRRATTDSLESLALIKLITYYRPSCGIAW